MAMLIITAMVNKAEEQVIEILERGGWKLIRERGHGPLRPDIVAQKGKQRLVIEVKAAREGRRDRVIPLLAQAILQAQAQARALPGSPRPVAILVVADPSPALFGAVEAFARDYAQDVGVGIVAPGGARRFFDPALDHLNHLAAPPRAVPREPVPHLFSDLNQWMLKVLLAPHLPPELLAAPRGEYRNASELASAANVSVMSAFRLVRQLEQGQHLESSDQGMRLVRLDDLFHRWRAAAMRSVREMPVRWILPGAASRRVRSALDAGGNDACLGLFAAADALGLGHVHGVAPHLYMSSRAHLPLKHLGLRQASPDEAPDAFLRPLSASASIMRGAVVRDGLRASDVLQVWLDVQSHPSRGREQADFIWRRVLGPAFGVRVSG
jgi:hypothetical protein